MHSKVAQRPPEKQSKAPRRTPVALQSGPARGKDGSTVLRRHLAHVCLSSKVLNSFKVKFCFRHVFIKSVFFVVGLCCLLHMVEQTMGVEKSAGLKKIPPEGGKTLPGLHQYAGG